MALDLWLAPDLDPALDLGADLERDLVVCRFLDVFASGLHVYLYVRGETIIVIYVTFCDEVRTSQ